VCHPRQKNEIRRETRKETKTTKKEDKGKTKKETITIIFKALKEAAASTAGCAVDLKI